jgi:cytoskeletal protein RodZ
MATFGETLKRERELRKISLREVSEATKIGLRYLEALEGNRFDQLPGGLFNKGFIRAYAKFIGLDGEAMVNAYLFDLKGHEGHAPARPRYAGYSIEEAPSPLPAAKAPAPAVPR